MHHPELLLFFTVIFGLFMAWGMGASDVANSMATSVGARVFTLKQAVVIAAVFEVAGALLLGGEVTETIQKKMINPAFMIDSPEILAYGMLAALLGSGSWLLTTTSFGWPVSTTQSIVGAIVGFGAVVVGVEAIYWKKIGALALTWVAAPVVSGIVSFIILLSIQKIIFDSDNPIKSAKHCLPFYVFLLVFIIFFVTGSNVLKKMGFLLPSVQRMGLAGLASALVTLISWIFLRRIKVNEKETHEMYFVKTEQVFGILMMFTACSMAFAHGSNDISHAVAPMVAVVNTIKHGILGGTEAGIPAWVMLAGVGGMVVGILTYGYRVIATLGSQITELTPSRGFSAELTTAGIVVLASGVGYPVSTTQTLVGAILGVGFARGVGALNLNVIRNIFMSWIITIPASAVLAVLYFYLIKGFFSWLA